MNLLSWNQEKTKRDEQSAAAAEGVTTGFENEVYFEYEFSLKSILKIVS